MTDTKENADTTWKWLVENEMAGATLKWLAWDQMLS
jgi:hypothetical protein